MLSARAVGLLPRSVVVQTLVYLLGSTLRHNAACIWNDICDRDFDRQVGKYHALGFPSVLEGSLSLRAIEEQAVGVQCGVGCWGCCVLVDPCGRVLSDTVSCGHRSVSLLCTLRVA